MDIQQFEVIRPKCAGLDVHKKSVVAAVCTSDPVTLTASYKTKVFNTTNSDIAALRDWLLAQDCRDVCMESTGKYWIPIFNILEPHMHVILTHPKYVKAIKGKKTTSVMRNGLLTCFALISSKLLLFPRQISGLSVNCPVTV